MSQHDLTNAEWFTVRSALLVGQADARTQLAKDLPAMIRHSYQRDLADYEALYDKIAEP